jgi:multidrug efflux pump subunit AcrA (membrane-fusion protein)
MANMGKPMKCRVLSASRARVAAMLTCGVLIQTLGSAVLAQAQETRSAAQPLETAEVQYRDVDLTYAAEAVIEAVRQSTVSAQVTGRIVQVNYDVGDYVKKGDVIVRIDQTEATQAVAGSQAQVAQAQAAYENARSALERGRELAAQKFISQAALDKAESEYRVAEAQLKAARVGASCRSRRNGDARKAADDRVRPARYACDRKRTAIQGRRSARESTGDGGGDVAQ